MKLAAAPLLFASSSAATLALLRFLRPWLQQQRDLEQVGTLVAELQAEYGKHWQMLSNKDGSALLWPALRRFLSKRKLPAAPSSSQANKKVPRAVPCVADQIFLLRLLLSFLRGEARGKLAVRASTVSGAGQGLFAARPFRKDELLCVYSGTPVSLAEAMRRQQAGDHGDYVMGGFGPNWRVDAGPHPGVKARYINDNFDAGRINARFVKLKADRVALVLAERDIEAGEEVFASYGEGYWRARTSDKSNDKSGSSSSSSSSSS